MPVTNPAAGRHAAASLGEAHDDAGHDDGAQNIGERRRGAGLQRHRGRQSEDAGADDAVHDVGRKPRRADAAHQAVVTVAPGRGLGLVGQGGFSGHGAWRKGSLTARKKRFFFEKKNQKTFVL
jgi:hypothetical protein